MQTETILHISFVLDSDDLGYATSSAMCSGKVEDQKSPAFASGSERGFAGVNTAAEEKKWGREKDHFTIRELAVKEKNEAGRGQ